MPRDRHSRSSTHSLSAQALPPAPAPSQVPQPSTTPTTITPSPTPTPTEPPEIIDARTRAEEITRRYYTASERVAGRATTVTNAEIDTVAPKPLIPHITVLYCWDLTGATLLDKNGNRVAPGEDPTTGTKQVLVINQKYPDKTQWRVERVLESTPGATCPEK